MKEVRLIIFDVDGTLTDGGLFYGPNGEEHKQFTVADGLGFRLAQSAGIDIAIISGRTSAAVTLRMAHLGAVDILQGVENKYLAVRSLIAKHGLVPEQVAFVGDDINDIPGFQAAGVRIATANAVLAVKRLADDVTQLPGGQGAGREAIEMILQAQGRLDAAIEAYVAKLMDAPWTTNRDAN